MRKLIVFGTAGATALFWGAVMSWLRVSVPWTVVTMVVVGVVALFALAAVVVGADSDRRD